MRNLLNFLARYHNLIIFLILEGIAALLLSNGNNYHNSHVVNGIRSLTYGIETRIMNTRNYLALRDINEVMAKDNAVLGSKIRMLTENKDSLFFSITDSIYNQQYTYTTSEIINNSVNKQKNFFTLNKGTNQGVTVDMAVTAGESVAGVIVGCSGNYSVAMSVLNLDFKLSARIKSNGYFGSLGWDGTDISHATLGEIPQHVDVHIGDTIETTGYSAIFPEGLLIGTINDYERVGGDFYRINIKLSTDFKMLHHVDIIGNMMKSEQLELEKLFL